MNYTPRKPENKQWLSGQAVPLLIRRASVERIVTLIAARRKALPAGLAPPGPGHIWGIALSGGGIRSATFCFGLLRALTSQKLLLRFDLMSTVSGGGYIASAIGSLFNRASGGADLHRIEETISGDKSNWFLWWLRANGRYLIPRGTRDRTYAIALFLRNLTAIHFELALIAVVLGLLLCGVDLAGWAAVENLGYLFPPDTFFNLIRWLPAWFPVVWTALPLVAAWGAVYSTAYWALPWVANATKLKRTWWTMLVIDFLLMVLFYSLGRQASESGSDLRIAIWYTICGLMLIWLVAIPVADKYRSMANHLSDQALQNTKARNLLTKRLTGCFQITAVIIGIGLVDRVAWTFAFEWDGLGKAGLFLAITAAVLRALLPLSSALLPRTRGNAGLLAVGHVVGYALTFVLCCWWVSLVQRAVLGALFTNRSLHYLDAVVVLGLIAVPAVAYIFFTGGNFQFLNSSSLHTFYKGRLTRSYLGAANGKRFDQDTPLGALNSVPAALPTQGVSASVNDVWPDEDFALHDYLPQRSGGPIHLINVCVNQTTDPRGRLFNQDRRGLPLTVASGGWMQIGQEGWQLLPQKARLTLGTWTAISGAALAPGLGAMTRGGIAALASFAGLRLGYWWSEAERTASTESKTTQWLAKSRGILSETFGVFKGAEGPDWFLTDGGHFDNTGAYSLLAERAEVILLADCGADPQYAFGDLENLVRKARIDLQAEIYFQRRKTPDAAAAPPATRFAQTYRLARPPQAPLPPELTRFGSLNELASPASNSCLALARIEYGGKRPGRGILIVVKPNLCDGLPVDLINFKAENPGFPQQTTADQFFSEAQWESYFLLGQFMGGRLSRDFIERLLDDPGAWFEDDECSPFDTKLKQPEKPATASGSNAGAGMAGASPSRLPARVGATAVGATLGLGAVATVGVSAWQAIDSVRSAYSKQINDERAALKDLTDLWTKLPPRGASEPPGVSTALAYGSLAAALARTADTLCPSDEAGWFIKSPLAARISKDALRGCRQLKWNERTEPCHVLIEAANPALKGPLPNCLAWEEKTRTSVPPPRYWAYDYSRSAKFDAMHPCDPLRAQLVRDEEEHRAVNGILTDAQTSSGEGSTTARTCEGSAAEVSEHPAPPVLEETAVAPTPVESGDSAAVPASHAADAAQDASAPAPAPEALPPTPAPAPAPSPAPASASPAATVPAPIDKDICKGVTVYIQIYGGSQRDAVRAYRQKWQQLGASVPPIEDVIATAQRDGRASPMPVRKTTVRFHDSGSVECARVLARAVGATDWIVEPLSARLKPTRGTIEVWVQPGSPTDGGS